MLQFIYLIVSIICINRTAATLLTATSGTLSATATSDTDEFTYEIGSSSNFFPNGIESIYITIHELDLSSASLNIYQQIGYTSVDIFLAGPHEANAPPPPPFYHNG